MNDWMNEGIQWKSEKKTKNENKLGRKAVRKLGRKAVRKLGRKEVEKEKKKSKSYKENKIGNKVNNERK